MKETKPVTSKCSSSLFLFPTTRGQKNGEGVGVKSALKVSCFHIFVATECHVKDMANIKGFKIIKDQTSTPSP